jgi:hypothetical protein
MQCPQSRGLGEYSADRLGQSCVRCIERLHIKRDLTLQDRIKCGKIHIMEGICYGQYREKKTPWPESASELYRLSDRRVSAKLVPTFADRALHVVSVTDPYGHILEFLDRSRYFFFQEASQL